MIQLTWAVSSVSLLVYSCSAQKQCFYPNGQLAANDFPCDPSAEASPCCGGARENACLTNKLCRGADGNIIRGSCTDKNWDSPECAQYCLSASAGGHDLISCSNVTKTDTSFCCDGRRAFCCDDGVGRFDVFPSNPQVLANWDNRASAYITVPQTVTSSSSSSSLTTPTPTAPGTSITAATTQQLSSSPLSTATSTTASIGTGSPSPAESSSALPLAAQAGIGAGAGIFVLALAAVAFLWFKLRRNKRMLAEKENHHHQQQQRKFTGSGVESEYKFSRASEVWQHHHYPPAYGEMPSHQGMMGLGVVPRQELDGGAGQHQGQARFELPCTPGRTPRRGF